ncbi:3'(2'),5'-bisphosphate nucleotidase CysQ [Rhodobacterales bacterium HKCCE2091]|nr:3'(2'),5'-bisphosphate nucleotidase CysQ [Rhodobacterales bacterium HKCCE2091]
MRHFGGDREGWQKPGGQGPLTNADLEIDGMLKEYLRAARPDYGWLSEETPDGPERLSRESIFVVDPIDGTRAFIEGETTWCISIGIATGGRASAGAIYRPARDLLYSAAVGAGARMNGQPISVSGMEAERGATLLTSRANLKAELWPGGVPPVSHKFRSSFANRLALVAQGRFDAMVSFRPAWDWDIAAGVVILDEAGGTVTDTMGAAPVFNGVDGKQAGILAATPAVHGALLERMLGTT